MRCPRFLLAPDTYERHALTAQLVQRFRPVSVLDVGGRRGTLARFLKAPTITAVNIDGSADLRYDGRVLPVGDGSFDVVASIDVLEHIPRPRRPAFVAELCRVARNGVVVAAPFGSQAHTDVEVEAERLFRGDSGDMGRFLREHIVNGLPSEVEIQWLFTGTDHQILFAGDCRAAFAHARRGRRMRDLTHGLGLPGSVLTMAVQGNWFRRHRLSADAHEYTNRVYVVCDLWDVGARDSL